MKIDRGKLLFGAAKWAGLAVRAGRVLFAPAAAAAVSAGVGEMTGHLFGHGLAPWVALTVAGGFGLWIAHDLHSVPLEPIVVLPDEE